MCVRVKELSVCVIERERKGERERERARERYRESREGVGGRERGGEGERVEQ